MKWKGNLDLESRIVSLGNTTFNHQASDTANAAGEIQVYAKNDDKLYMRRADGTILEIPGAGAQGYQGLAGSAGAQGYQGLEGGGAGSQGPQGPQGTNGTIGSDGVQGSQGPQGLQGTQGYQGPGIGQSVSLYEKQTATAGQTLFNLSGTYVVGGNNLLVFRNGKKLVYTTEYTETSSTSVTLTSGAIVGDILEFVVPGATNGAQGSQGFQGPLGFQGYQGPAVGQNVSLYEKQTATAGQTLFTLTSGTYVIGSNSLLVFRNGKKLVYVTEYTETSSSSVTLTTGAIAGAILEFVVTSASSEITSLTTKTDNYSVLTSDLGTGIVLGSATAADKAFTLPSVGSSEDGAQISFSNDSDYVLTIATSDSDSVWKSGDGYGVEMPVKGTNIILRYDHSNTRWDIMHKAGGRVLIEGTKLYLPTTETFGVWDASTERSVLSDRTHRHAVRAYDGDVAQNFTTPKFHGFAWQFPGASPGYFYAEDSADWDAFGSTSDDWTLGLWVYCDDAAGSLQVFLTQYEDIQNRYELRRTTGGALELLYRRNSTTDIQISGGSIAQNTWHYIAACKVAAETGIYLDGTQVAYDAAFTADTFTGGLYLGMAGNSANYYDGKMDDVVIVNQNIFNAAPNSTPNDTITVPGQALEIVM